MKLMSLKQYMKKSKKALIAKLLKSLKAMSKKELAIMCYQIQKSKLPQLKTTKRKALPNKENGRKGHKAKRKFTKKQLAAQELFAKRAKAGTLRKKRR